MKFDFKNSPVLKMLDSEFDISALVPDLEVLARLPMLKVMWAKLAPLFKKEIFFLTQPFIQGMKDDTWTWSKGVWEDFNSYKETTFMDGAATLISKYLTHCFYASADEQTYCMFEFAHANGRMALRSFVLIHPDLIALKGTQESIWTSSSQVHPIHAKEEAFNVFSHILAALYFIKNVEAKTKVIVPPHKKIKYENKEKFINETPYHIDVLDVRWYSTIVRTQPFRVDQFDRQQRYGPGFSQVKTILIRAFWKQGYTYKARILEK
jgi:hypothetical protein